MEWERIDILHNTFRGTPLTSISTYNITCRIGEITMKAKNVSINRDILSKCKWHTTLANASGLYSKAASQFSSIPFCNM